MAVLIAAGYPQAAVVTRSGAPAVEEYAAEELRRHLAALGGGNACRRVDARSRSTAKTSIYVNDVDAARAAGIVVSLTPEAFHIQSVADDIYILGGSPRGVLYGVYAFLESLGCRWFTPDDVVIPTYRRLVLPPMRVTEAPAFEFRDMWVWEGSDPVWWTRNRMNGWYTPVPDYMGGHIDYHLFVHSFYTLMPPEEFFAEHPDYYSLIDGVRRHEMGQLCLTHPDVLRIVTARVLARMRANPRATIFSVSQNDWAGPCACPACQAIVDEEGAQSGPLIRFVNAVAEATAREFPDKLIDTLAYWYTLDAPLHAVPHPNVRVRLCSIRCCQGHGYGTCDHPESARFLRALDDWGRVTKQMYIWHYCTDFAHYPLPMPNLDEIQANIRLYQERGVYGVFMQGMGEEGGGAELMALRGYVISRLLWNPNQDVWSLVDEFLAVYYGKAATAVREYLDLFHERVRQDRAVHPSLYDPPTSPLFDGDILDRADATLAAGERRVRGTQRRRVRLLRDGLTYARLLRVHGAFRREGDTFKSPATPQDAADLEGILRDFRAAGMRRIREGAPLEVTANILRNRLNDHPLELVRDGDASLVVAPTLGGRLLEWHAVGRQWLALPDLENEWSPYPMSEGYSEHLSLHAYTQYGTTERYRCRRSDDGRLFLSATLPHEIRVWRQYRLGENGLEIQSRFYVNGDLATAHLAWGMGMHLCTPGATVRLQTADGLLDISWDSLSDGLGNARIVEQPVTRWSIFGADYAIHAVPTIPVPHRYIIGKVERTDMLAIDVRTDYLNPPLHGFSDRFGLTLTLEGRP